VFFKAEFSFDFLPYFLLKIFDKIWLKYKQFRVTIERILLRSLNLGRILVLFTVSIGSSLLRILLRYHKYRNAIINTILFLIYNKYIILESS